VNEESIDSVPLPERLTPLSRFPGFVSAALDTFSFLFFCLSFSSLTHVVGAWWSRWLAEE
jgi:hypothetical protein